MMKSGQALSDISKRQGPVNILLVEDDASDAVYLKVMLDKSKIGYHLTHLKKGTEVIPYLMHKGDYAKEPTPDLILLDLGLPCQDGFEVLNEISSLRGKPRGIPIVILTGYDNFTYLKNTHNLCIFDYMTKPCNVEKLSHILGRAVH